MTATEPSIAPEAGADLLLTCHGTISILTPLSPDGEQWIEDHIGADAQTWGRNGIVIEHRYVDAIVDGIIGDGLGFDY